MGGGASLYPNQAWRQRGEEGNDLTAPEALVAGHLTLSVNRMNVKYVLRDVQASTQVVEVLPTPCGFREVRLGFR